MKAQLLYQHLCQPFVEAYDIAAQPEMLSLYYSDYSMSFEQEKCRQCLKLHTNKSKIARVKKCSNCECTYHPECAAKLSGCSFCKKGQLIPLSELEKQFLAEMMDRNNNNQVKRGCC